MRRCEDRWPQVKEKSEGSSSEGGRGGEFLALAEIWRNF
jgi:hypothetical protein